MQSIKQIPTAGILHSTWPLLPETVTVVTKHSKSEELPEPSSQTDVTTDRPVSRAKVLTCGGCTAVPHDRLDCSANLQLFSKTNLLKIFAPSLNSADRKLQITENRNKPWL